MDRDKLLELVTERAVEMYYTDYTGSINRAHNTEKYGLRSIQIKALIDIIAPLLPDVEEDSGNS